MGRDLESVGQKVNNLNNYNVTKIAVTYEVSWTEIKKADHFQTEVGEIAYETMYTVKNTMQDGHIKFNAEKGLKQAVDVQCNALLHLYITLMGILTAQHTHFYSYSA